MTRHSLGFRPLWTMSAVALVSLTLIAADTPDDVRQLKLRDWAPKSMLVVAQHELKKPLFPAIDVHNHLGGGKQFLTAERVGRYLEEMNEAGVRTVVNLDGGWGERLKETLAALDEANPGRFLTFALIDFAGIDDEGWSARETKRLDESFRAGAKGLKFHKTLGLYYRYKDGKLMPVDDPKLSPIFELCGKHGKPVMIHTADPAAFFTPLDRFNERWHELNEHPDWLFYGDRFPKREELLAQFIRVVERHPKTTFIGAHFGNNVEDLATVGQWLDRCPNLVVDIDARISELGRQPYTARKFFLKHQDRIMFGTDTTPRREAFRIYYRFLETEDEYFDCAASHHLQGFWQIYGIHLPREVLQKVYYQNAERVLAGAALPVAAASEKPALEKPLIVDLWPGKPPGDVGMTGEEKFFELKVGGKPYQVGGKPTKWLTNVTKPSITVYRPAKDRDTGVSMLICPGGGYHNLGWDVEGEEIAAWLNSLGMTGIILKYRCPRRPGDVKGVPPAGPLKDAQRAVSLVRSKAKEWGIDPAKIGMVGFSAGGHLVGATATAFEKRTYEAIDDVDKVSCRPDFAVMLYSGYFKPKLDDKNNKDEEELSPTIRVAAGTPPLFLVHATDDTISNVEHSVTMYLHMKRAGIPAELHVYATGGHGFGVRKVGHPCETWTERCTHWLRKEGFLKTDSGR